MKNIETPKHLEKCNELKGTYTEEEVNYLLYSFKNYLGFGNEVDEKSWFETFKKK